MIDEKRPWTCPECTAGCTFEAMMMCQIDGDCPTIKAMKSGEMETADGVFEFFHVKSEALK